MIHEKNHRITEGVRLDSGSAGATYLLKQGHKEHTTQDCIQFLNISSEGDSTTSLGNLFQSSVTHTVKRFFLIFRWNFLCISFCPLPLVLSLGTTEKNLFHPLGTFPSDIYRH